MWYLKGNERTTKEAMVILYFYWKNWKYQYANGNFVWQLDNFLKLAYKTKISCSFQIIKHDNATTKSKLYPPYVLGIDKDTNIYRHAINIHLLNLLNDGPREPNLL